MTRQRILVIEDDDAIRRGVCDALRFEQFVVLDESRGDEGRRRALAEQYDLLLLDLVLPGCQGLEILADVREARPTSPIIILTACGAEADRVAGLKLGADDYVVKPFSMRELVARVEAVLRRSPDRAPALEPLRLPGAVVDLERREGRFDDGTRVELSEREAGVLSYLCGRAGRVVSRDELLRAVWQLDPRGIESRTIDMHIARLREKLRDDAAAPRMIVTVRGKGYLFALEPQP